MCPEASAPRAGLRDSASRRGAREATGTRGQDGWSEVRNRLGDGFEGRREKRLDQRGACPDIEPRAGAHP